ncbi:2-amino-4-hydroxy-6-hydroxymethyldihydropteridine diphosphokinase [Marinifilum caeruleilacunae]|uniref:2-amino-4-hydroxy-6-hydroxymethyldihydropteridine pyrophosphokinase n=1 Tax=Marinifilum caeruleilacunae TaxID=2499076 RepID=A0ABX1X170_9BACT|nr:2-amino-4-hydroxy-6-hydroxymethyldihydropteridine diphosphokinase [Marinifilum caeruleilacunae]NOU62160.1 2-amino-4-hydroxy-6-hydroxymethyldihydropteridine diphosphokinase [Marinifilum caeruleilacunae]
MAKVYFLIGGNLGDRELILIKTIEALANRVGKVLKVSAVYETEPWGFEHEQSFLNQVVLVETSMLPEIVLDHTQAIENELGRVRKKNRYSERTIDIDMLFYNDLIIDSERLEVPHPRMGERMFALAPLAELASEMIHPVNGKSILEMKNACPDGSQVSVFKA